MRIKLRTNCKFFQKISVKGNFFIIICFFSNGNTRLTQLRGITGGALCRKMRKRHVSTFKSPGRSCVRFRYVFIRLCNCLCERFRPPRLLKNAVHRNIVFIAASLKYARLMFPIGDRVDNGRALRSNKDDVSPCA